MNPLDREARASRYLGAMEALEDMLSCRVMGLNVRAEPLAMLLGVMNDEAAKVVRRHTPGETMPGFACANDHDDHVDDDGGGDG